MEYFCAQSNIVMKNILHLKKMQMCFISRTVKHQTMNLHFHIPEVQNAEPNKGVAGAELGNYTYLVKVKPILKICGVIFAFIYLFIIWVLGTHTHVQAWRPKFLTSLMPEVPFTEQNVTWTLKKARIPLDLFLTLLQAEIQSKNVVMESSTFNLGALIVCIYLSFIG